MIMRLFKYLRKKIHQYIVKRATEAKLVDIVEVRTKTLGLTYVNLETDIKITNRFFLPIKILEIKTDIVNVNELKVGMMTYDNVQKIKANSEEVFTTHSKMSNITAFFNLLSKLLTLTITIRSVGYAKIKVLWFVVDVPVDDTFEIMPSQLKVVEELTEEEKARIAEEKRIRNEIREEKREQERLEKLAYLEKKKEIKEEKKELKTIEKDAKAQLLKEKIAYLKKKNALKEEVKRELKGIGKNLREQSRLEKALYLERKKELKKEYEQILIDEVEEEQMHTTIIHDDTEHLTIELNDELIDKIEEDTLLDNNVDDEQKPN